MLIPSRCEYVEDFEFDNYERLFVSDCVGILTHQSMPNLNSFCASCEGSKLYTNMAQNLNLPGSGSRA